MGGDQDAKYINSCAEIIKNSDLSLNVAWYSGKQELSNEINLDNFNYIKLGPYIAAKGPLDNPNTNQRLYKVNNSKLEDITNLF